MSSSPCPSRQGWQLPVPACPCLPLRRRRGMAGPKGGTGGHGLGREPRRDGGSRSCRRSAEELMQARASQAGSCRAACTPLHGRRKFSGHKTHRKDFSPCSKTEKTKGTDLARPTAVPAPPTCDFLPGPSQRCSPCVPARDFSACAARSGPSPRRGRRLPTPAQQRASRADRIQHLFFWPLLKDLGHTLLQLPLIHRL